MLAARHRARLAMEEGNDETRALKHRNVRRKLFVDDEESSSGNNQRGAIDNEANYFVENAKENLEKAKERWNFDFEKEEPLPGRYEWIKGDEEFSNQDITKDEKKKNNIEAKNNTEKS
ncbi:cyclin-dependent kinase inhibitor 1-like isoform X2 [Aphidius gifuensis]|uniref:cyclin-dependent kinase inhibitor 1-like isoform X2 n=1 Tax=Aphidius gifuensis TaxID=684658 RepID=UPI001CDB5E77|nr:cyclin-dependent kinase inhibitor 1-like isoform X2 [Aphidius gifuensis]